jgi:4-amino-4-deoxy-L-arabinose transferase-like glycosyltransferase
VNYATVLLDFVHLMDSRRASIAGVAVLVTLLAAVNVYYFHRSQTPTFWDDSSYLTGSLNLYDALTDKGIPGFATAFAHLYGNKAPLICVFPIPIYLLFGREYDPRCLVSIGFLILMSVYLFRLGACLWSPREGLLAVAIVQTMPLLYGLSRQFLVDYGLATMVVMWMYYLLSCRSLTTASTIVRLGIVLGIGMLMKISFPLYIGAPTIVAIWAFLRADRSWRMALKTSGAFGCILLIGGIIASSWYLPNLKTVVGFALSAGFGQLSVNYGSTIVFSWSVISNYFYVLINVALSCYYAVLLIVLAPAWVASIWRRHAGGTRHALALVVWVVVPLVATTFAVNKDPRFTTPVLPVVALFLARMIRAVFDRWRFYPAAAAALMIVPALAYASASLSVMERFGGFSLGRWAFWSPHLAWYASIPSREGGWDQWEMAGELCRDARQAPLGARLLIPLSHLYLNNGNLAYLTTRLKCNVEIIGLPQLQTPKDVADFIDGIKPVYVLVVPNVPEPQLAPEFANVMKDEAEKMVTRPNSGFHLLFRRSLGVTGKDVLIYRRD